MATTTPNFGWSVPTSTDLVKDGATAIETLGDSIDASLVDLKGGTTGQVLAKNSNTDMDFTWVAQDDSNAIQNAIVDAKGDLIAASAADTPARLAVGTNGQVLQANSSTSTGLEWVTLATGGGTLYSQSFTSSTTWTVPTGVSKAMVFIVGGGGAGGGGSSSGPAYQQTGGGGGGRVYYKPITLVAGRSMTITIGAGGSQAYGVGGEGGNSEIVDPVAGSLILARGGGGGGGYPNYAGTVKSNLDGCAGGAGGESSSNYSTAGGGGGAGGDGMSAYMAEAYSGVTTFTPQQAVATNGPKGGRAFTSNKWGYGGGGGVGVNGYGGGGGGYGPMGSYPGADGGGYNYTTSSGNGTANTGGGGRGINGSSTNEYGGAGGSGFIRIEWVA